MRNVRDGEPHPTELLGLLVHAERRCVAVRSWAAGQSRFLDLAADDVVIDLRQGSVSITS